MGKIAFNAVTTRETNKAGMGHVKHEDFHQILGTGSYFSLENGIGSKKQNRAPFNCASSKISKCTPKNTKKSHTMIFLFHNFFTKSFFLSLELSLQTYYLY